MLQRRLSVGFNRATRLMDELEAAESSDQQKEQNLAKSLNDKSQLQNNKKTLARRLTFLLCKCKN